MFVFSDGDTSAQCFDRPCVYTWEPCLQADHALRKRSDERGRKRSGRACPPASPWPMRRPWTPRCLPALTRASSGPPARPRPRPMYPHPAATPCKTVGSPGHRGRMSRPALHLLKPSAVLERMLPECREWVLYGVHLWCLILCLLKHVH